jgi:hypothetical protein
MDKKTNIDYLYILGASHSGSTLLAMLLNAHPDLISIGESSPGKMGDIYTYRCSCGKPILDCLFWKSITRKMHKKHPDFSLDDFGTKFECPSNPVVNRLLCFEHRGFLLELLRDMVLRCAPHWKQSQDNIMARCYDLVSTVLSESGGRIFVDSSKLAHRLKYLLKIPEFNIKVIHLVRDGRAVALTYMKQDEFADAKEPDLRRGGRGMDEKATVASLPMIKAADEWRRCLKSAEHLLAGIEKSRWIQVHYEELCKNPEATLKRIHGFLGTNFRHVIKDFRSVENHIIGNGMRLDTTSEIRLDERWRSVITKEDSRTFNSVAGKMNRRYGYE